MKRCEICRVRSRRVDNKKRMFMAGFPLDEARCKEWVRVTGNEDLVYVPIEKLSQLKFVCENHFQDKDFNTNKTKLRKTAIPSLNLWSKPLPDEMFKDFPLHIASDRLESKISNKALVSYLESLPIANREHDYCPTYTILNLYQSKPVIDLNESQSHSDDLITSDNTITSSNNIVQENLKRKTSASPIPSTSTSDHNINKIIKAKRSSSPQLFKTNTKSEEKEMTPSGTKKLKARLEKIQEEIKILRKKDKLIKSISSPVLKSFIETSITNNNRKPNSKRWSELNKTVALAIYKKSPKTYQYISQLLPFPSVRTLRVALEHVKINTCIDKNIMNHLKKGAESLSHNDKICVILFNKMPLKEKLTYNAITDKIDGYEDFGFEHRSRNIADHVLVCMLQGIHKNMKQPISHYFFRGTLSIERLAIIIEKNVRAVVKTGYNVIAMVCDHGSTNMGALNLLKAWGNSAESHYFFVDDKKIFIIYDVPHLFKSIRNNFLQTGEIILNNKRGKWNHLIMVEKVNQTTLHFQKITKLHVNPTFKSKMKVKLAVQILSNTVAAILKLLSGSIDHQVDGGDILQTAYVIEDLDRLFDCTNGPSSKRDIKRNIRENVRKNSFHHSLWIDYKIKLRTLKFINSDNEVILKNVRCINGYLITLSSLQDIWSYMESRNIEYLNLRRLNQGALENLFEMVKQFCPPFNKPTCHQFISALRSSILTHLSVPVGKETNCEEESNTILFDFQKLIFPKSDNSEKENKEAEEMVEIQKIFKDLDKQPTVYVSGYLASVLLKYVSCRQCINSMKMSNHEKNTRYDCISLREWWKDKSSLTYPTEELCQTVDTATNIFETAVQPNIYVKNILDFCKKEIRANVDLTWICEEHKEIMIEKLLRRISLLLIRNHCQITNKLLNKQSTTKLLTKRNNEALENEYEVNNIQTPVGAVTVYLLPTN